MILFIEASAGVSGDMLLKGLLDLGLPVQEIRRNLRRLGGKALSAYPAEWIQRVKQAKLKQPIKSRLIRAVTLLAKAEGAAHRRPWRRVLFHQLRGPDTLEALVGFCTGLDHFRIRKVYSSPVPLGSLHQDPHGKWRKVPGPATRWLLRRFPVEHRPEPFEWTTPTGAALLAAFASSQPPPPFEVFQIGVGKGRRRSPRGWRVLRLFLGRRGRIGRLT